MCLLLAYVFKTNALSPLPVIFLRRASPQHLHVRVHVHIVHDGHCYDRGCITPFFHARAHPLTLQGAVRMLAANGKTSPRASCTQYLFRQQFSGLAMQA